MTNEVVHPSVPCFVGPRRPFTARRNAKWKLPAKCVT